jgi:hypothetical protein
MKPTSIDRADMFEGQLIDAQGVNAAQVIEKITAAHTARISAYQARIAKQYGVDFAAGDSIDMSTGTILWHEEKTPNIFVKKKQGHK